MSLLASLAVNVAVLCVLVVLSQVSALHQSYDRLASELSRELGRYRVLLVTPRMLSRDERPGKDSVRIRRSRTGNPVRPLTTPDPRFLRRLDPQLQEFAAENQEIEDIFTREIVRDVDAKVLDVRSLFETGSLQVSFEPDAAGKLVRRRVDVSSGVPSIDHLALEIVGLVENYQLAWVFREFSRVALLVRTGEDVEMRLTCTPRNRDAMDGLVKRIQGTLALLRIAAAQSDAAFLLQEVTVSQREDRIILSRKLSKEPLVTFLMRYWQTEAVQ